VLLDFFDDVFLLHFALKTAQCIFQRLTFLNADFCHLDFTVLPMHVANTAVNHNVREGNLINAYWQSLLADPSTEVKLCFLGASGVAGPPFACYGTRGGLLLECPGKGSARITGAGYG
jgi:hypothetical protein